MNRKKRSALFLLICSLVAAIWYFGSWSWTIGTPTSATITHWDTKQEQRLSIALNGEQLEQLCHLLKRTTPTFFIHDPDGINNEDILITLSYPERPKKVFSLWCNRSILYEGNAENLTMATMKGSIFHSGGSVSSGLQTLLQQLTEP